MNASQPPGPKCPQGSRAQIFAGNGIGEAGTPDQQGRGRQGFAIIVVLAFIVLLTFMVVAFFSQAINRQQILGSISAQFRSNQLARAMLGSIKTDLRTEIAAGSTIDTQNGVSIYTPSSNRFAVPAIAYATDQSVAPTNVIKRSAYNVPFFSSSSAPYNTGTYPASALASNCNTGTPSLNGRAITKQRWNAPYLIDPSLTGSSAPASGFLEPDWIIATRSGPRAFSNWDNSLKDPSLSNTNFAIGRYAYVIYDEGGLLNINVAGNLLQGSENSRRGRLNQADLTQIPGMAGLNITDFLKWRAALTGANNSTVPYQGGLFDPERNFVSVITGSGGSDETLVTRQDLIKYALDHLDQFGTDLSVLQYLGTFSRELNAPSFSPSLLTSATNISASINPALTSVRFSGTYALADGTIVTPGTPVVRKRFPLSRLAWITARGPSADLPRSDPQYNEQGTDANIFQYFGLKPITSGNGPYATWLYRPSNNLPASQILTLSQLTGTSGITPRDPDFFELLQATILKGSLGQYYNGDAWTNSGARDQSTQLHVMQIGANLIDEYSSDGLPKVISFTNTSVTNHALPEYNTNNVRGVENLPYINELSSLAYRPVGGPNAGDSNRSNISFYLIPRFWNPNQPLHSANSNVLLRMTVNGGTCNYQVGYAATGGSTGQWVTGSVALSASTHQLTFPNGSVTFADPSTLPSTLGTVPSSQAAGLLSEKSPAYTYTDVSGGKSQVASGQLLDCASIYMGSLAAPDAQLSAANKTNYNVVEMYSSGTPVIEMQYSPDGGTTFIPYQRFDLANIGTTLTRADMHVISPAFACSGTLQNAAGASIDLIPTFNSLGALDPHTPRLGLGFLANATCNLSSWWGPTTIKPTPGPNQGDGAVINPELWWYTRPYNSAGITSFTPAAAGVGPSNGTIYFHFGYYSVNSGTLDTYYLDPDSVLRRADGDNGNDVHPTYSVSGSNPTTAGSAATGRDAPRIEDRPLILNRPFRSVGEMGYASRDVPWKTLNFFSADSGDAGLLDAFSLDDTTVAAGRVSLNTRWPAVLQALLAGALKSEYSDLVANTPAVIGGTSGGNSMAVQIANFITQWTSSTAQNEGPLVNRSQLATEIVASGTFPTASNSDYIKTRREATVRALAEAGQTRTWNLLIDVIAQTGRYPASVNSSTPNALSQFVVEGECRYWLHVAIDRYTGQIVDEQWEPVYE